MDRNTIFQLIELVNTTQKSLAETASTIIPMVQKTNDIFIDITQTISKMSFPEIDYNQLIDTIENLKRGLIESEKDLQVFKVIILNLGYPPHIGMDIREIRRIVAEYQNDAELTAENIDHYMRSYYDSKEILNIGSSWERNPMLKSRLSILRNVLMAHNLGMYGVSVPTIVSQFEGVLVDSYEIKGIVNGKVIEIILENLLRSDESNEVWSFDDEIYRYYDKNLLVKFKHGQEIQSDLSRHAILHGASTSYNKETTSLKAILLFDHITEKLLSVTDQDKQLVQAKLVN
ncbi:hypothetical protein [Oceanobacillus sp. 1P07AA]|uniref:hypothetical protein n=1 Tax=Oceanobacillus sp. 1P07AA TaxID=3132293 RepID=UPI0039A48523